MKLFVEWGRLIVLKDATKDDMIFKLDLSKVPTSAGVYMFGRQWGRKFEALYVGKGGNVRGRVHSHLNNLRLMHYLRNARTGKRVLLAGRIKTRQGQRQAKCLLLAERTLLRHFLSEGHKLVNKQGTRISRHELTSSGAHPKRFFPKSIFVEKTNGE